MRNALELIKYNTGWIVIFAVITIRIKCELSTCFTANGLTFPMDVILLPVVDSLPGPGLLHLAAVGRLEVRTIFSPACLPCVSCRFTPVKVKIISLLHQAFLKKNKKEELVSSPFLLCYQTTNIFKCTLSLTSHKSVQLLHVNFKH